MKHKLKNWLVCSALACVPVANLQAQSNNIDLGALLNAGKSLVQSQAVANMSTEEEVAVGKDIVAQMLGKYPLATDAAFQHYINQVGVWLALRSTRPDLPWRFAVLKSDTINAFAAPGGTVLVTSGMVKLLTNEAELACVLGHEIAHISRRHHIDVMQKNLLVEAGASALNVKSDSGLAPSARKSLTDEGKELLNRKLDRGAEREADEDGLLLAARAGYDPAACLNFMQRLASLKADSGPLAALYKTHPQAKDRAVDVDDGLKRLQGASAGDGARPALMAFQGTARAKAK